MYVAIVRAIIAQNHRPNAVFTGNLNLLFRHILFTQKGKGERERERGEGGRGEGKNFASECGRNNLCIVGKVETSPLNVGDLIHSPFPFPLSLFLFH